jgi:hypothetical protein
MYKLRCVIVVFLAVVAFVCAACADAVRFSSAVDGVCYFEAQLDTDPSWFVSGYLGPRDVRWFQLPDVSADLVVYVYYEATGQDAQASLVSLTAGKRELAEVLFNAPGSMVGAMNDFELTPQGREWNHSHAVYSFLVGFFLMLGFGMWRSTRRILNDAD